MTCARTTYSSLLSFLLLVFWAGSSAAASPYIPPDLAPWEEWVLDENDQRKCPFLYNRAEFSCVWVSASELSADPSGMDFRLQVRAFAPRWIDLPGNDRYWPRAVSGTKFAKQTPLPVRAFNGRPQVKVDKGESIISGRLSWDRVPANIPLPKNSGLVTLRLNNEVLPKAEIDRAGNLWLRNQTSPSNKLAKNALTVQVFRLLKDENPAKLITRVVLEVSGEAREIKTGKFLLDNFLPLALKSELPARIDEDKNLRVQVKSGHWEIELTARYQGQLSTLAYSRFNDTWPAYEIWAFEAKRALQIVEISGAPAIDPSQTNLPAQWRNFPAYQLQSEQALSIKVLQRGDPTPEADSVQIRRDLFLDFDGRGFTAVDNIEAQLKRSWRLDTQPQYQLGSVRLSSSHGQQQALLITESADGKSQGVELRVDKAQLLAVSRVQRHAAMSAAGWRSDVKQLQTQLHLPPGWSLLAASGVDKAASSWVERWTLWDIFLVLIIVVATFRLYGLFAAGLAAVTLLLIYHRVNAPVFIWLNTVVVLALLSVASGKIKRWLSAYLGLSLLALLVIILPFSVSQLRSAVYPQLAGSFYSDSSATYSESKSAQFEPEPAASDVLADAELDGVQQVAPLSSRSQVPSAALSKLRQSKSMDSYTGRYGDTNTDFDPQAIIQTGPGVPNWRWSSAELRWNGPVSAGEDLRLYLVPPWLNRMGNVLAVLACVLFAALLALRSRHLMAFKNADESNQVSPPSSALGALLAVVLLLTSLGTDRAHAQVNVDKDLLIELQQRLTRNAECLPACVAVQEVSLAVRENRIAIEMTIDAQDALAAPLPAQRVGWTPASVSVDNKPALLWFNDSGQLFVYLTKGSHRVVIKGELVKNDVELNFGLALHNFSSVVEGWEISGARGAYVQTGALQLTRIERRGPSEDILLPDPVPPFVTVSRRLMLGLDWKITTTVTRIAPAKGAISVEIPLLDSEAPLSDFARKGDALSVTFGANQNRVSWQSNLPVKDKLMLTAPEHHRWAEVWTLSVSPVWHTSFRGIAAIKQEGVSLHTPMWMPWPGETLAIEVARPPAAEGASLTVDSVNYQMNLGQRTRETELSLALRTSRGQNYPFALPEGAVLDALWVNNIAQPLVKTSGVIEIPLRPGNQRAKLKWHQDTGVGMRSSMPQLALGDGASNINMSLRLPRDRWTLAVGGPLQGPAVLFWGVVLVVVIGALILSRSQLTPLGFHHWLLLGLGVCSTNLLGSLFIIAWLLCVGARGKYAQRIPHKYLNVLQILVLILTLAALLSLLSAISMGLLSSPDMHIGGNGSNAYLYRWYQDRIHDYTPGAWVISVPILYYRIVMLAWALWLSVVLLNWLKWEWQQLNENGFWQRD